MSDKIYSQRSLMMLDRNGGHFMRHLRHMTSEDLHEKSDIAAELAFRDWRIEKIKLSILEFEKTRKTKDMEKMFEIVSNE